jgi:hypothetical protein
LQNADESDFTSAARRELFRHAKDAVRAGVAPVDAKAAEQLSSDGLALFTELTVGVDGASEDADEPANEIFGRLEVFALERDIKKRRDVLQEVNPVEEPSRHDELFSELVKVEAKRRDTLRRLQESG